MANNGTEMLAHFLFSGFAAIFDRLPQAIKLILKNPKVSFVRLSWSLSNIAKSDAIGGVELGMVQGFRRYLNCENQTDK